MERRNLLKAIGGIAATASAGGVGVLAMSGGAAAQSSELSITNSDVSTDDGDLSEVVIDLNHVVSWDGFDVGVDAISYTDKFTIEGPNGGTVDEHVLLDDYIVDFEDDLGATGTGAGSWGNDESYDFETVDEDDTGPGPSVTDGTVESNIVWTVLADQNLADNDNLSANSIQTAAVIGRDVADLDNDGDGTSVTYTIKHDKIVKFYRQADNGKYYQLGSDDGTVAETVAEGSYDVTITNEEATDSASGTGSSTAS